jgi:hypothetical protein
MRDDIGKQGAFQMYRDPDGVIRWKSNHLQVPDDIVAVIIRYGIGDETENLAGQRRRLTS